MQFKIACGLICAFRSEFTTMCVQYFKDWFPDLLSYQAFNRRLNELAKPLKILVFELMAKLAEENEFFADQDCVIDSMPIMLAVHSCSYNAKIAADQANKDYCSSKDIYYNGVKMHILARKLSQKFTVA